MSDNDHISPRLDDLGTRLDRIETKLDDHLQRVSQAEKDIEWVKGWTKISITGMIAALGGLLSWVMNRLHLQ